MNPNICLYFQVHQPYRLRDLRITDIGKSETPDYFDHEKNRAVFRKVAEKCYLPATILLEELLHAYPGFSMAFSLSGTFIDQCREYGPDVLASFQRLNKTGRVEFLAETYYHSLSSLTSTEEFCEQVTKHVQTMRALFGQTPSVFRNTELIYSNHIAQIARLMGFAGILAEGADHLLAGRSPNAPFIPPSFRLPPSQEKIIRHHRPLPARGRHITILLKNYRLSDDIAFRFSDRSWTGYPLRAEAFTDWIQWGGGHTVNLFMDFETFGEHQWADTGIFDFLRTLPRIWQERRLKTKTPSEIIHGWQDRHTDIYDAHSVISWADMERDLSAWQGNQIQRSALEHIYALENTVKHHDAPDTLLETWRRLQTSDHFYYMCTKYWNDGDVHKYFSPYDSPYEAYRRYSHALHDLQHRLTTSLPLTTP